MSEDNTYIRFEYGVEDRLGQELGPFPYVQITYNTIRIGPDGEEIAFFEDGLWTIDQDYCDRAGVRFSDAVIYSYPESN